MYCPKCNCRDTAIIDSRMAPENEVRRRRECEKCGYRFTTYEMTGVAKAKREKSWFLKR